MAKIIDGLLDSMDSFLAWFSSSLQTTTESYCDLQTADSPYVLVAHDGSLVSVLKIHGVTALVGEAEFRQIRDGLATTLRPTMSHAGHALQVYFSHSQESVAQLINENYQPAYQTSKRLGLDLDDLFEERTRYLSYYCAEEVVYFVFWTRPNSMATEQLKQSQKDKVREIKQYKVPPFKNAQNIMAAYPNLRDPHDAFVRATVNDLNGLNLKTELLEVHEAVYAMRRSVDPDFTAKEWRATLPGDKIPVREVNNFDGNVSDIMWPPLAKQILPRDAINLDRRTAQIGDKIYASVFIDLFPKDVRTFLALFQRTLAARVPWRISFLMESEGLTTLKLKGFLAAVLSFSSAQNRLISDSANLLRYISVNTDDTVVRLRVTATTWAKVGETALLRTRLSELAKAIQGWGGCETSEYCGDAFAGIVSSMLGVTLNSVATPAIAPVSDIVYMLPVTRPASPWTKGALLLRSADGKPWPFQPGSSEQTTWIDIIYARPGSGKSVLSNALNLALCLQAGIQRLPLISVIDIGPSSSGLISLLREALPPAKRHLAAYHRLRMRPEYAINPFDTQLGCRFPTPSERAFLVNFLTLLATPLGAEKPYDAVPDLAGIVVDELYKHFADSGKPHIYVTNIEPLVDGILEEVGFVKDTKTTWWEVTDALFAAGFPHEAMLAQRYAMPLLADATSICRQESIRDLYGKIVVPTGESLIDAFGRMISGTVREYSILSSVTRFDLGESRVVALDLDEVAKSGGDAADRQSAVMYMVARYVLARHYYLTEENLKDMPHQYQEYHQTRIADIRDDQKRIVYDEFHRTSHSQAVREQVILDMREGRKWKVQIALISQSIDDFEKVMIEFATSIYIMDAGPAQAIEKTAEVFGLSPTGKVALRTRVQEIGRAHV